MGTFSIHLKVAISVNKVDELSEIKYNNPSSSSATRKRRAGTEKTRNVANASYQHVAFVWPAPAQHLATGPNNVARSCMECCIRFTRPLKRGVFRPNMKYLHVWQPTRSCFDFEKYGGKVSWMNVNVVHLNSVAMSTFRRWKSVDKKGLRWRY